MTATERLRKLLDERGIHWWAGDGELDRKTHWESGGLTWEYFNDDNGDAWLGFLGACESDITPEQAIDATLGGGKLTAERVKDAWCGNLKRECLYDPPIPDWQAIADELNAMLGAGTCRMIYDEEASGDEYYPTEEYRCSECGKHVYAGKPNYCPACGKRVEG